jgi:hypothetical protein
VDPSGSWQGPAAYGNADGKEHSGRTVGQELFDCLSGH